MNTPPKSPPNESPPPDAQARRVRSFPKFYNEAGRLKSVIEPVGKLIGYGKHSVVYQGRMTGSGQSVTIKVDDRPILSAPEIQAEYNNVEEQVDRLKRLKNPAISRLIDWIPDWEKNRSYIIMQYIEGNGLNQELADKGPFPQGRVLDWACQILDAMKYLHKNRYIIGDLDSSNIVLTPEGRVCLVDFRYLTAMGRRARGQPKKPEKGYFGRYNETKEGEAALQAGIREDMRHLGATLYELLTGYDEEQHKPNDEKTLSKGPTVEERKAKLSAMGVSDSVAAVILKALSESPENRYASAREMLDALQTLPTQDAHSLSQMAFLVIGALTAVILLALGLSSFVMGQRQVGAYAQMKADAASALSALQENDYTAALRAALEATRMEDTDPPCPPEAQAALAQVLAAYDYIPGYKPRRSDYALRGRPIEARFSPDGTIIAVLVEDADAYPSAKRIQFFDAQSGEETSASVTVSYAERSAFAFLNDDTLFYAGENAVKVYSLSKRRDILTGPPGSSDSRYPVGIAVSDDGTTAASVRWGDDTAYVYDAQAILDGRPQEECYSSFPLERPGKAAQNAVSLASTMDNLLALSDDGRYLAVSFADGGICIYDLLETDAEKRCQELLPDSGYVRFEGGFCEDFFVYGASSSSNADSQVLLYRLSKKKTALQRNLKEAVHIQADRDGIFLSMGDWLYSVDTELMLWEPLAQTDGEVRLLRHIAGQEAQDGQPERSGRLLAVTDSGFALVYRDDGKWRVETAKGAFNIAGLSNDYLFLAMRDKQLLSALKWRKNETSLLDYIGPEEDSAEYYEHRGAHIRADGKTAMLYRPAGFRVYDLASGTLKNETDFDREAERVSYQRAPLWAGDPDEECLKVVYADKTTAFYSSLDGSPLASRDWREEDSRAVFVTDDYRAEQAAGGPVKISSGSRSLELPDKLTDASQQGERLIVSLITDSKRSYSLLLDKNLDVVAELPEPCEAASDALNGTLVFDDTQGHLFQGSLYSLEDLRARAIGLEDWRVEAT